MPNSILHEMVCAHLQGLDISDAEREDLVVEWCAHLEYAAAAHRARGATAEVAAECALTDFGPLDEAIRLVRRVRRRRALRRAFALPRSVIAWVLVESTLGAVLLGSARAHTWCLPALFCLFALVLFSLVMAYRAAYFQVSARPFRAPNAPRALWLFGLTLALMVLVRTVVPGLIEPTQLPLDWPDVLGDALLPAALLAALPFVLGAAAGRAARKQAPSRPMP